MDRRAAGLVAGAICLAVGLAGCGQGVSAGAKNAAENPATGIYVASTTGAGNTSGHPVPPSPLKIPSNRRPAHLPPGLVKTTLALESAVTGGCWENARAGDVYGAWDQLFWWVGECAASIGDQMTVELYPSAAAAMRAAHHASPDALQARYLSGAVLVDVFTSASPAVTSALSTVKGLSPVPGYGS